MIFQLPQGGALDFPFLRSSESTFSPMNGADPALAIAENMTIGPRTTLSHSRKMGRTNNSNSSVRMGCCIAPQYCPEADVIRFLIWLRLRLQVFGWIIVEYMICLCDLSMLTARKIRFSCRDTAMPCFVSRMARRLPKENQVLEFLEWL